MNDYLSQLTYDELDALYFVVWNADPASPILNDISAAINRLQFPVEIVFAEVVEEPVVLELVAGMV